MTLVIIVILEIELSEPLYRYRVVFLIYAQYAMSQVDTWESFFRELSLGGAARFLATRRLTHRTSLCN